MKEAVEIIEQRTRSSKSFQNEDGTVTVRQSGLPMHYLDEEGNWQEIHEKLITTDDNFQINKGSYSAVLPLTIQETIQFDTETENGVRFEWLYTNPSTGILNEEDNKVVYPEAWPSIDLEYTPIEDRIKNYIIIKEPVEQDEFQVRITDNEGRVGNAKANMKYVIDQEGKEDFTAQYLHSIQIEDIEIPRLFGHDANNTQIGIDHFFSEETGILRLKIYLPEDVAYPVMIDPTITGFVITKAAEAFKLNLPLNTKKILTCRVRFTRRYGLHSVERSLINDSGEVIGTATVGVPYAPSGTTGKMSYSYHTITSRYPDTAVRSVTMYSKYYNSNSYTAFSGNVGPGSGLWRESEKSSYLPGYAANTYNNYNNSYMTNTVRCTTLYDETTGYYTEYPNIRVGRFVNDRSTRWLNPNINGTSNPSTTRQNSLVLTANQPTSPWYDVPDVDAQMCFLYNYTGTHGGHILDVEYTYSTTGGVNRYVGTTPMAIRKVHVREAGTWVEKNNLSIWNSNQWAHPYAAPREMPYTDSFEYLKTDLDRKFTYFQFADAGSGPIGTFSNAAFTTTVPASMAPKVGSKVLRIGNSGNADAYMLTKDNYWIRPTANISYSVMCPKAEAQSTTHPDDAAITAKFFIGPDPATCFVFQYHFAEASMSITRTFENTKDDPSPTVYKLPYTPNNSTGYNVWIDVTIAWQTNGYLSMTAYVPGVGTYSISRYDTSILTWCGYGFGYYSAKSRSSTLYFDNFKINGMS